MRKKWFVFAVVILFVSVSEAAELPRSRQFLYIFELEGIQTQYDATIRKGLVNDIREIISRYGKEDADFNYKIGNLPSTDYPSPTSALNAVDSFVKGKIPEIVPIAKDYIRNKSLDYISIDYYFAFTENGKVADKWIYMPVKIDKSVNITYPGARIVVKPRYSFAYYRYITKRMDAGLPSNWSISEAGKILRYFFDLNGNVALQNTFDVASRYDAPESQDGVVVDKEAGLKFLINERIKLDLQNEGIPYALLDYGYATEPLWEVQGDGSLVPVIGVSTVIRKFTRSVTNVCTSSTSTVYTITQFWEYECREYNTPYTGEHCNRMGCSYGYWNWRWTTCPAGDGSEISGYSGVTCYNCPQTTTTYTCSSQKDPNNGTYYNKHEIGWMLSMDFNRYYITPSGSYSLIDQSNASGISPTEIKGKTVAVSNTSYATLSTKIIDPFNTTTIYDVNNDAVNNLPANRYTYLAPIEVE